MKKIWKWMVSVAVCMMMAAAVPVAAANGVATKTKSSAKQPSIDGKAGIVMDAKSGKILYAKNIDERHYPASITKILTTLVAIENCDDLYEEVTFSTEAVNNLEEGSTHIGIKAGEKIQCWMSYMESCWNLPMRPAMEQSISQVPMKNLLN